MSIAEGVQCRVVFKEYATGVITSNTLPVPATDPAATGGQILRRVTSTLNFNKDTYQSNEVRTDRQIVDFRHGVARVAGSIQGELSCATYEAFFEAAMRGTWEAAIAKSNTEFTSVTSDNTLSQFVFAGGDPVTQGYRVGHILRFTNLATAANNTKNFLITGFSGASNRTVSVYPAPTTDAVADSSFNVTSVGKRVWVPSTGFVSRKFAFEHYYEDLDLSKFFAECRVAGFNIALPATGLATCEFPMMGRDQDILTGASAPFWASPTAATSTGVMAAVNGLLRVGGTNVGVITGMNLQMIANPTGDAVVGQNFVPEIFLGRHILTGTLSAELENGTFLNNFVNEDEIEILCYLTASNAANPQAISLYIPRVKFGGADNPAQGEGAQLINLPFQALKYVGSGAGIETTTFQMCDTEVP